MQNLKKLELDIFIKEKVSKGIPLLGICLGMQMLFEDSSEFCATKGLNLIKGNVTRINSDQIKLPHMGWNKLIPTDNNVYSLRNLNQYFVHSYAVYNAEAESIIFKCNYENENFVAAVKKNNIVGLQFHPERSGISGMNLLSEIILDLSKNFNI